MCNSLGCQALTTARVFLASIVSLKRGRKAEEPTDRRQVEDRVASNQRGGSLKQTIRSSRKLAGRSPAQAHLTPPAWRCGVPPPDVAARPRSLKSQPLVDPPAAVCPPTSEPTIGQDDKQRSVGCALVLPSCGSWILMVSRFAGPVVGKVPWHRSIQLACARNLSYGRATIHHAGSVCCQARPSSHQ